MEHEQTESLTAVITIGGASQAKNLVSQDHHRHIDRRESFAMSQNK